MIKKPETLLDKFRIQEADINRDVTEAEKHYDRVILEQEKVRDKAKGEREKAAAVLAGMIAGYERIDRELEAEERKRLDAEGLTKAAVADGRLGAEDYVRKGITDKEAASKIQAAAGEKLADLQEVTRAQAVKVLELETAELEAEYNIAFAQTAPGAMFRERLAALLKNLEALLASPLGVTGGNFVNLRDAKRRELYAAMHAGMIDPGWGRGTSWQDRDVAGLKRLRLDPTFPPDLLPELEKIIAEAKTRGQNVRIMWARGADGNKMSVSTMWR